MIWLRILLKPYVIAATGVLVIALLTLGYCHQRDAKREAQDNQTVAEARTTSAVEAISEIGKLEDRGQVTQTQVEEAQNAIRQAPPAGRDAVARAQLCRLQHRTDCDRML